MALVSVHACSHAYDSPSGSAVKRLTGISSETLFALCLFSIKDSISQAMTSADNDVTENVCMLIYMNDHFFIFNPCVFRSQNEIDGNIGSNPSSGCLSSDSCSFSKISQSSTEDLSGNLFNLYQKTIFCW